MNPLLRTAIALVRGWTQFYTLHMDPACRDNRRAEIESDLWDFHEDARRGGYSPTAIALHMIARLIAGLHDDLRWRIEYEGEAAASPRRSTWMTAAAIGATVGIALLWAFFAVTSIGALPPLPDASRVERVYLPRKPPPPPPPPLPGIVMMQQHYPLAAPPPR
jgi:hypothetical protein